MSVKLAGAVTKPTFGTAGLLAVASAGSLAKPIFTQAAPRMASSFAARALSASTSAGSWVPVMPRSAARTRTMGLETSRMVTSMVPSSPRSSISLALPVGKSLPVLAPAGSRKLTFSSPAVPSTPAMEQVPSLLNWPSLMGTSTSMVLLVFRLNICTTVVGSVRSSTRPISTA